MSATHKQYFHHRAFDGRTFTCPGCGQDFLIFIRDIKRYTYKLKTEDNDTAYYCRYNCWIKDKV